jgi:hypothetical protein
MKNRTTRPDAGVPFEFVAVALIVSCVPALAPVSGVSVRRDGTTVFATV